MNITSSLDNDEKLLVERPGAKLAMIREVKGFSMEYIAEKLHLRVQLLELLETDSYARLPEPVFVKGYLRAYARLMDVSPEPYIKAFLSLQNADPIIDKPIWNVSRLPNHKKRAWLKWLGFIASIALVSSLLLKKYNHEISAVQQNAQSILSETKALDIQTILPQTSKIRSFFKLPSQSVQEGSKNP